MEQLGLYLNITIGAYLKSPPFSWDSCWQINKNKTRNKTSEEVSQVIVIHPLKFAKLLYFNLFPFRFLEFFVFLEIFWTFWTFRDFELFEIMSSNFSNYFIRRRLSWAGQKLKRKLFEKFWEKRFQQIKTL